jgi:hypothetical protein
MITDSCGMTGGGSRRRTNFRSSNHLIFLALIGFTPGRRINCSSCQHVQASLNSPDGRRHLRTRQPCFGDAIVWSVMGGIFRDMGACSRYTAINPEQEGRPCRDMLAPKVLPPNPPEETAIRKVRRAIRSELVKLTALIEGKGSAHGRPGFDA